jgi:GT2 family glycosyltransferase
MVIEVFQRSARNSPYLSPDEHSLIYFPNNTLCLRRSLLEQTGGYDENLSTAEDVELGARIYQSAWRMYRCPGMHLHHRPRRSLQTLLRQWWGYGKNIPRVFKARNPGDWEVVLFWSPTDYLKIVQKYAMPFTMCLFLNPFLLMHALAAVSLAGALAGWPLFSAACAGGAGACAYLYFCVDFVGKTGGWGLAGVRYLVNLAFFAAHLVGGWSCRCLYFPQNIWERRD